MGAHSYEDSKKAVWKGFGILLAITVAEVLLAIIIKKAMGPESSWYYGYMLLMVVLSLVKATYIVMKFMHLGDEVKSMRLSIILPLVLLVWAVIAFLWEGDAWKANRATVINDNIIPFEIQPTKSPSKVKTKEIH